MVADKKKYKLEFENPSWNLNASLEAIPINSLDTDSKLRHDTVRLSRTKHTDKTHVRLTSRNQIYLDQSWCAQSHYRPNK